MSVHRDRSKDSQSFGRAVGGFCTVAAVYELWRGRPTLATWLAAIGVTLLIFSIAAPRALDAPARVWWRFAEALGWFNTRLLLTAFFVVVLTPTAILFRMIGRDTLGRKSSGSNWMPYPVRRRDARHYERMF